MGRVDGRSRTAGRVSRGAEMGFGKVQHSLIFGGIYDDGEERVVMQSMVDQEEQVRQLEEKIKTMQVKVPTRNLDKE